MSTDIVDKARGVHGPLMRKNRNSVYLVDLATVGAATLGVVFLPHPKTTPDYQPSVTGGVYGGFDLFGTQVVFFSRSPSSFPLCGLGSDFRSSVLPDLGENPSLATVFLDFPFVTQTSQYCCTILLGSVLLDFSTESAIDMTAEDVFPFRAAPTFYGTNYLKLV